MGSNSLIELLKLHKNTTMLKSLVIIAAKLYFVKSTKEQIEHALNKFFEDSMFRQLWADPVVQTFQEYGCWCYFPESAEDLHLGKGHPQDPIDTHCQTLSHGYECAYMDSGEEFICEPWNQMYIPIFAQKSVETAELIYSNCKESQQLLAQAWTPEQLECAIHSCAVETQFLAGYTETLMTSNYQASLSHKNGFNVTEKCVHVVEEYSGGQNGGNSGNGGNGGTGGGGNKDNMSGYQGDGGVIAEKECCGVYPKRFPYHPVSSAGFRQCCVDKTYNDLMHVCCEGQIQAFCA